MILVSFIFLVAVVASTAFAEAPPQAAIERFCIDCHDADAKKGGVDLDSILTEDLAAHTAIWEKVVKQLSARHMPPIGKKRPDEAGYADLVAALTKELDAQPARPSAGPAFRRLTRTEYQNAVRDLLAVEFDAKAAFPTDETAMALTTSPSAICRQHCLIATSAPRKKSPAAPWEPPPSRRSLLCESGPTSPKSIMCPDYRSAPAVVCWLSRCFPKLANTRCRCGFSGIATSR